MKKIQLSVIAACGIVFSGLLLMSCKKSHFENTNPETARLMAVNLAPERTVSVTLSGNLLGYSQLAFNSYTGGYLSVYPGERSVQSFDDMVDDSLSRTVFNFEANKYYSLFVVGSGNNYQNVIAHDNIDSLSATSGQAYVRYINAINGSNNPLVTFSSNGNNVVNENAAFASISNFTAVTPGELTIAVSEGTSIQESRTITVEAKKVYTILLTSGATAGSDPQIKFIVNGVLDDDASQRNASGRAVSIQ